MPLDVGKIHLVGIGGIGMSGIAEILHNMGYEVGGSDISENANVERLRALGINVVVGHNAENIADAAVVVKSTAVRDDNPEIMAAREAGIPVIRRSEMLAEITGLRNTIAIAGTHGKTTTTSLVGCMLDAAGFDPTIINGGIINTYGTNAHLGGGEWLVAEADESDGTFINIPAAIGVITNIDPEHLDYWGSYEVLLAAFADFIHNLPFYGFAVLCCDNAEVQKLAGEVSDRRVISYGITSQNADVKAVNISSEISGSCFDVEVSGRLAVDNTAHTLRNIHLPITGRHNILNSLAAIAIAYELGVSGDVIAGAFGGYSGVKRRFTKTGEVDGVTIIDDYGHHPTEIAATLKAACEVQKNGGDDKEGRIIAILQPHRYSRLKDLFDDFLGCFSDADIVVVSDVFAAGEDEIAGVNRDTLVDGLRGKGVDARPLPSPEELPNLINEIAQSGDMVICLGAGNITHWANELPAKLTELSNLKLIDEV